MTAETILVVDDEPDIRAIVRDILDDEGYQVVTAENADRARAEMRARKVDLALLDIWMPDTDGMTLLKEWMEQRREVPVIMISGHGTVETAVDAIRIGAYDFLEKPLSTAKLLITVDRALQNSRLQRENRALRSRVEPVSTLVGSSPVMAELRERLRRIAATESWVLLTGEPGSGKEVAACMLHRASPRAGQPLVHVSLAAIPAADVPTHLFGAEGSGGVHKGRFEEAAGGTLMLDEIVDLDPDTQAKLLNALQERRFVRVGGTDMLSLDVRILSLTNQNIEQAVRDGRFREDLYYRLNVVPARMPALREHREDVSELVQSYLQRVRAAGEPAPPVFSAGAMAVLQGYHWPGNVRELNNTVQRLLILHQEGPVVATEVKLAIGESVREEPIAPAASLNFKAPLREARDEFERAYFTFHLNRLDGNVAELAHVVGMERTNLYRKLKGLGIDPKTRKSR